MMQTIRNALDDALYGAVAHPERIVQRKVPLDEGLHPSCKGNHPPLGLAPVLVGRDVYRGQD